MKLTLLFVDDDEAERAAFRQIVELEYEYVELPWPRGRPIEEFIRARPGGAPDIVVLDLYLPPEGGSAPEIITADELARQQAMMARAIDNLSRLYPSYKGKAKDLLRDTMRDLSEVRAILDAQWQALGQSPDHGVALMQRLRARYPGVPVVFYSRKITPEDVRRVLAAGAADAIRKRALTDEMVPAQLKRAREIYHSAEARGLHARGLNANVTLFRN
jgi:DNA-binding NarL/FixJ family response regulator